MCISSLHNLSLLTSSIESGFVGPRHAAQKRKGDAEKKSKRKSVRFTLDTQRETIDSSTQENYLTETEIEFLWYNSCDYEQFAKCNKIIVSFANSMINNSETLKSFVFDNNECLCLRGLEHKINISRAAELRNRKKSVVRAVLDEQRNQQLDGKKDRRMLRKVSQEISKASKRKSLLLGRVDDAIVKSK